MPPPPSLPTTQSPIFKHQSTSSVDSYQQLHNTKTSAQTEHNNINSSIQPIKNDLDDDHEDCLEEMEMKKQKQRKQQRKSISRKSIENVVVAEEKKRQTIEEQRYLNDEVEKSSTYEETHKRSKKKYSLPEPSSYERNKNHRNLNILSSLEYKNFFNNEKKSIEEEEDENEENDNDKVREYLSSQKNYYHHRQNKKFLKQQQNYEQYNYEIHSNNLSPPDNLNNTYNNNAIRFTTTETLSSGERLCEKYEFHHDDGKYYNLEENNREINKIIHSLPNNKEKQQQHEQFINKIKIIEKNSEMEDQLNEADEFSSNINDNVDDVVDVVDDDEDYINNEIEHSIMSDRQTDEKASFVSNLTITGEKGKSAGVGENTIITAEKKRKFNRYLEEHRNALPTERRIQLKEEKQTINSENFCNSPNPADNNDDDELIEPPTHPDQLVRQLESIKHGEIKYRIFEKFIIAFNKDPQNAIDSFVKKNIIKDDKPETIANYLLNMEGLNKKSLGEYFGKNNEKNIELLRAYIELLDFRKLEFDLALRKLLSKFRLPGEAQQIERIVMEFALVYYEQNKKYNPNTYTNADELFPLAYAIIMLATDAHNPKNEKKMSLEEFIINTKRPCPSIENTYLEKIYKRITGQKLETQNTIYDEMPELYLNNLKEALEYKEELKKGMVLKKIIHNKRTLCCLKKGPPSDCEFVTRKLFLSKKEDCICWITPEMEGIEEPRVIFIEGITDLTIGIGEHLKAMKNIPKECDIEFFTITTNERTLDIRTESSKTRSMWLNYLRAILIEKRHKRIDDLQKKYSEIMNPENLENVWKSEILPHWDQYWDYELKKPKQKWVFKEHVEKFCGCFSRKNKELQQKEKELYSAKNLGIPETYNVLENVWRLGLIKSHRKALWEEIIGNPMHLNSVIVEELKKRTIKSGSLRAMHENQQVIETAEFLITVRPDLPHVKDLLETSKIFHMVFSNEKLRLITLTNFIHKHHFLAFYKGDEIEIDLRLKLFEILLEKNLEFVKRHFEAIKLKTKFYLIPWFLSVFYEIFKSDEVFMLRIWDNFIVEGEIYLFKVGIALIKYYEIELKMCSFYEGLKILKFPSSSMSPALFFEILTKDIVVTQEDYFNNITKRKHAMVKTKIQSILLVEDE